MSSRLLVKELLVGGDGLTGSKNLSTVRATELLKALNVSFDRGTITKEGGSVKYNSSAISGTPKVSGGHDWIPSDGTQRSIIYTNDGKILRDTGAGTYSTTVKTGLDANALPVFIDMGQEAAALDRKLLMVNNVDVPQVISADGVVSTELGVGGIDAPGACVAALAATPVAGNVDNGTHSYKITFTNSFGETEGGSTSNVVTVADKSVNGQIELTSIPLSGAAGVVNRKVYRTVAGDTGNHKLVGTISNNTATTFTDNVADGSLGADVPTTSAAPSRPADWASANQPSWAVIHEGRLFGGGNKNNPHRVYWSTAEDHEDLVTSGSGSGAVYPGEGERIVAAVSFKGLLVMFKSKTGIYAMDTSNALPSLWRVTKLSIGIGMASPLAVTMIDDDVLFCDSVGNFQLLSTIREFGNLGSRNLTQSADMGAFMREFISKSRFDKVVSIYYVEKREAHFAFSESGSLVNDFKIVLDFNKSDIVRFRVSDKDTCESLWLKKDANGIQRPACGDDAGFVWDLDDASKAKDGVGYSGEFQIPHNDFGNDQDDPKLATKIKYGAFLEMIMEPQGNWNLNVDIIWDGVITQVIAFNMGVTGASLGSFVLGTDKLAGDSVLNKKRRISGGGRRFSTICRNNGAGQDFSIAKMYLHMTVGDERL